jgi:hypothetical protein
MELADHLTHRALAYMAAPNRRTCYPTSEQLQEFLNARRRSPANAFTSSAEELSRSLAQMMGQSRYDLGEHSWPRHLPACFRRSGRPPGSSCAAEIRKPCCRRLRSTRSRRRWRSGETVDTLVPRITGPFQVRSSPRAGAATESTRVLPAEGHWRHRARWNRGSHTNRVWWDRDLELETACRSDTSRSSADRAP